MSDARILFKTFLAERWFGGPDFDSWVRGHPEHEDELRHLRDEWLDELRDPDNPGLSPPSEPRRAGSFAAGERVAGFVLVQKLGSGASGEVWEAEELALGRRRVALKLLRPDLALDSRILDRFLDEPITLSRIQHPGVVTVYSAGRDHGQPWIAEELVEGGRTLATIVGEQQQRGQPSTAYYRRVADLAAQVAEALAAAHAIGIVHRDVKPANLLIAPGDHVKVADFGLAHLGDGRGLSQTGDVIGTLCYMSPAQARGEIRDLNARADVFSLGATLYELLTLQRAFTGSNFLEISYQIQFVDPPSARSVQPRVPPHLALICAKALEKRESDRLTDMRVFAAELRRFLEGEPSQLRRASLASRVSKWVRRHPTSSAIGTLGVAALSGFLWLNSAYAADKQRERIATLRAETQLAIGIGDTAKAERLVAEADALDSDDPTGHLLLATGFASLGNVPEAEEEVARAAERGFEPDPERLTSALEHGAYALYLMTRRDFALYPEAETHIARALELDPRLYGLELSRYHMRIAVGDDAGALEALDAFRAHVPASEPEYPVLTALHQEASGDERGALATLDAMRAVSGATDETLAKVRWHRHAGRLCANLGELARAEEYLRRAVADAPNDCWSWDGLAAVQLKRLRAGDTSQAVRAAALEFARRAQECGPSLPNPSIVLAYVALLELRAAAARPDVRTSPAWGEARAALDRLRELQPQGSRQSRQLEAYLFCQEARHPFENGQHAPAAKLYEQAFALDPEDLDAGVGLVQCHWFTRRFADGLAVAREALARWDDPSWQGERVPAKLAVILAWNLGHASGLADAAAFREARARFLAAYEGGLVFGDSELLSAAEFLATAPGELSDCDLAWRLIDEHDLETAFVDHAGAKASLEAIREACK